MVKKSASGKLDDNQANLDLLRHEVIDAPKDSAIDQGFDISTKRIQQWEVDAIRRAVKNDELEIRPHVINAFFDEDIPIDELPDIIRKGKPSSKDIEPKDPRGRQLGINFEGKILDGRKVNVKVSYDGVYWAVTGYVVRR